MSPEERLIEAFRQRGIPVFVRTTADDGPAPFDIVITHGERVWVDGIEYVGGECSPWQPREEEQRSTHMTPEEFKQIRKSLGLSQVELARLLVRDVMSVSRWERGVHPIPGVVQRAMRAMIA